MSDKKIDEKQQKAKTNKQNKDFDATKNVFDSIADLFKKMTWGVLYFAFVKLPQRIWRLILCINLVKLFKLLYSIWRAVLWISIWLVMIFAAWLAFALQQFINFWTWVGESIVNLLNDFWNIICLYKGPIWFAIAILGSIYGIIYYSRKHNLTFRGVISSIFRRKKSKKDNEQNVSTDMPEDNAAPDEALETPQAEEQQKTTNKNKVKSIFVVFLFIAVLVFLYNGYKDHLVRGIAAEKYNTKFESATGKPQKNTVKSETVYNPAKHDEEKNSENGERVENTIADTSERNEELKKNVHKFLEQSDILNSGRFCKSVLRYVPLSSAEVIDRLNNSSNVHRLDGEAKRFTRTTKTNTDVENDLISLFEESNYPNFDAKTLNERQEYWKIQLKEAGYRYDKLSSKMYETDPVMQIAALDYFIIKAANVFIRKNLFTEVDKENLNYVFKLRKELIGLYH